MWRAMRILLFVLMLGVTLLVFDRLLADDFPFKGWAHFSSEKYLDRQALGYSGLPKYHAEQRRFEAYGGPDWRTKHFGYWAADYPHWPGADPGLGPANPPPPMVRRAEIRAAAPSVLLVPLALGWLLWSIPIIHRLATAPPRGRGFPVTARPPQPTTNGGTRARPGG